MYYIISTVIILIATILFIIFYHNNIFNKYKTNTMNFIKNIKKTTEFFITNIKSKNNQLNITQLTYQDSMNILHFLKMKYNYDSILIPKILSDESPHIVLTCTPVSFMVR